MAFAIGLLFFLVPSVLSIQSLQPQQVHLSYGDDQSKIFVTWVTLSATNQSVVEFGRKELDRVAKGTSYSFTDSGLQRRTIFIHRVKLHGLKSGAVYYYHCGSKFGWSSLYQFHAPKAGTDWTPHFVVFGDLGNANAQSLARIQKEAQLGIFDAVLHLGNLAFDLETDDALVGDEFMRQIEPIAAYVPYMTCVGDREHAYNFSNYANRFTMPNQNGKSFNNFFYSWNVGSAHIIAFSTEFYFFVEFGWGQIVEQFKWLENDLKEANKLENRSKHPWIITMGHRPMYCSNNNSDDCTKNESIVRTGIPHVHAFGLEELFYKYGVDLELWAHEHSYERLWPVYNRTVLNGSDSAPYDNPKAPVHITTGSAGSIAKHDSFSNQRPKWSAFRNDDYGYTRLFVINGTHLFLEQISQDKNGAIIDRVMINKKNSRPAWM